MSRSGYASDTGFGALLLRSIAGAGQARISEPRWPSPSAALRTGGFAAIVWARPAPSPASPSGLQMHDTAASPRMPSSGETEALLQRVGNGDRDAFEALYRAVSAPLLGVCMRLIPDRGESEDVLQEVFVTVWHKAHQFDASRASALTWLASIARNKSIDRLRSGRHAFKRAAAETLDELSDPLPTPAANAETVSESARLRECLDELDERRGALIRTAFFEGATYEALAERIGSPIGSVKSWIRRGLIQLRTCLER